MGDRNVQGNTVKPLYKAKFGNTVKLALQIDIIKS